MAGSHLGGWVAAAPPRRAAATTPGRTRVGPTPVAMVKNAVEAAWVAAAAETPPPQTLIRQIRQIRLRGRRRRQRAAIMTSCGYDVV